jgi:hypothetical protein
MRILPSITIVKRNICNVGITIEQRDRIIEKLKYGESINGFVQRAVQKELEKVK